MRRDYGNKSPVSRKDGMMEYGIYVTDSGWELLGRLVGGSLGETQAPTLTFTRVGFGNGKLDEGENPVTRGNLKSYVADGGTTPINITHFHDLDGTYQRSILSFTAEYRSDMAPDVTEGFWLSEFGIFCKDEENNVEIMVYYATLGDAPQYVTPFNQSAIDIRRFPVQLVLTDELNIVCNVSFEGFIKRDEMEDYGENTLTVAIMETVVQKIADHNDDPDAHFPIRALIAENEKRVDSIEYQLGGVGSKSFFEDFAELDRLNLIKGVWNAREGRLEY
jgi:hypothetical protein